MSIFLIMLGSINILNGFVLLMKILKSFLIFIVSLFKKEESYPDLDKTKSKHMKEYFEFEKELEDILDL